MKNRFDAPDMNGASDRRALMAIVPNPIAAPTIASASHVASHMRNDLPRNCCAMIAAPMAVTPTPTPPHPGMDVNDPARSIASRMNRMLSSACSRIGRGASDIDEAWYRKVLCGVLIHLSG